MAQIHTIYQTLQDKGKGDVDNVEKNGPFPDNSSYAWLGKGCYLWDANIEIAHWWGYSHYIKNDHKYIICSTSFDASSEDYLDLLGNYMHRDMFWRAIEKTQRKIPDCRVCDVINILKTQKDFLLKFKAVRDYPRNVKDTDKIYYTRNNHYSFFERDYAAQLCVWDKSFLKSPFIIVFPEEYQTHNQYDSLLVV